MSEPWEKYHHGLRRWRNETAIKRQMEIAKGYGAVHKGTEPHRYNKMHAMNCGNPGCHMCGNPRRFFGDPTIQERRFDQNVDSPRDRKSNGSNDFDEKGNKL